VTGHTVVPVKGCRGCKTTVAWVSDDGLCVGCTVALLTQVERDVFHMVRKMQPTSIADVADEMRFASTSTAYYHLKKLQRLDLVEWEPMKQNTLREKVHS
jgi:predicted MarR family transcription regulator